MSSVFKNQIILHAVILCWGFTGILGKWIAIDAFGIVWYRVLIALVSLLIFASFLKKRVKILDKKVALKTLGVGVLVALHWLTFYLSIKVSTASLAIVCLATATIHVSWLEPLIMKRKFQFIEFVFGIFIVLGIVLIAQDGKSEEHTAGIIYGLLSALFAAAFSVFNAYLVERTSPFSITVYEMFSGVVLMSVFILIAPTLGYPEVLKSVFDVSIEDILWLLFLGVICTSVAFIFAVQVTKILGAFTVTLSINMEPIYTMILAAIFLKENDEVGDYFYYGAAIIIAVVFANGFIKFYLKQKAKRAVKMLD